MAGAQGRGGGLIRDERYCSRCSLDTPHLCVDDTHERDSSGDYRQCLRCGWEYFGTTGRYTPPDRPVTITEVPVLKKPEGVLVSLIAAVDEAGLIGRDDDLPWKCPVDMARFKRLTYGDPRYGRVPQGKPVILGRVTYNCIERKYGKVMPGRNLMLVSKTVPIGPRPEPNVTVCATPFAALDMASVWAVTTLARPEILVAGGAKVYKLFMPIADRVYLTTVDGTHTTGTPRDVYFPDWDRSGWTTTYEERFPKPPGDGPPGHLFEVWARKPAKG